MITVGDRLPDGVFRIKQPDDSVKEVSVADLFDGQRVVLVGVPGAFTSTCHRAHIPQFVTHAGEIKARGADRIVVMAVNDHHVMQMWAKSLGGEGKIDFVADGDGIYAAELGLAAKFPGMGTRVRRFSALVEDRVVKTLNFEADGAKGVQATGAEVILAQL